MFCKSLSICVLSEDAPRVSVHVHIPVLTFDGDGADDGDDCTGLGIVCVMHNRDRIVIKCVNIVHAVRPAAIDDDRI